MQREVESEAATSQPDLERSSALERPSADLRCANPGCQLYRLKLEPDEVEPTPGPLPSLCASCGKPLLPYPEVKP